jgi:acyl carrier protein
VSDRSTEIGAFLAEEALMRPEMEIEEDTPLLNGLLDSASLASLLLFLEDRFNINVDYADVTPENFATPAAIDAFVGRALEDRR